MRLPRAVFRRPFLSPWALAQARWLQARAEAAKDATLRHAFIELGVGLCFAWGLLVLGCEGQWAPWETWARAAGAMPAAAGARDWLAWGPCARLGAQAALSSGFGLLVAIGLVWAPFAGWRRQMSSPAGAAWAQERLSAPREEARRLGEAREIRAAARRGSQKAKKKPAESLPPGQSRQKKSAKRL